MKTNHYILALDQGTTGSTALIVDISNKNSHKIISQGTVDFKQHYPKADWVEHDLEDIWNSCIEAIKKALSLAQEKNSSFKVHEIKTIGITNQRETLCVFSRENGSALHPAIVWQCKRSLQICSELKEQGLEDEIKDKTGLLLDPYFTGTKIKWLMENEPNLRSKILSGKALLGTIDTFLLYRLTREQSFFTEPSNASRTLLYNLKEKKWDHSLLEIMGGIPESSLPRILDSHGHFGVTKGVSVLPDGISIHGILGDQQASLFGHKCFDYGESKCTYGTGAFFLMNTKDKIIKSHKGLLTTVAWQLNGDSSYALEGSCFIAGAAVSFLRDNLKLIQTVEESSHIPPNTEASPHLYYVPALCGLGAPHWKPEVKGAFLGLTRSTSREQIIKACLEGICFQVEDLLSVFRQEASCKLESLCVDGGASSNDLLMEIQAYLSNLKVTRPKIIETTAYGAALMAAYGTGLASDLKNLKSLKDYDKTFKPDHSKESQKLKEEKLTQWSKALSLLKAFY